MIKKSPLSFRSLAVKLSLLLTVALLPVSMLSQTGADSTAPTSSTDPAAIDQAWQKASSKYDAQRSAILKEVDQVNHDGPFRADWQSLQSYQVPDWYKDAKFGIFIHGCLLRARLRQRMVSAADVHSELGRIQTPHCDLWTQDKFGYKDFIPMRKAEKLDPAAWASLFKDSGAPNMWCRCLNTTTASPCTTADFPTGRP